MLSSGQNNQHSFSDTTNGHAAPQTPQAVPLVANAGDASSRQQTVLGSETAFPPQPTESLPDGVAPHNRGPPHKNFVSRLYDLVNDPTQWEVIRWAEDGNGFAIVDQEKFRKEIVGTVFKHNNMASFIRQLNMYDFHKRNRAGRKYGKNDTCFFQHQAGLFRRGHPDNLHKIKWKGPYTRPAHYPGSGNGRAMSPIIIGSEPYNVNPPAGTSQKGFNELKHKYDDASTELKTIQDTLQQFLASQAMQRQPLQPPLQMTIPSSQRSSTDSLDSYAYDGTLSDAFDSHNNARAFSTTRPAAPPPRLSETTSSQDRALVHYLDGHYIVRESHTPFNTSGAFCDVFVGSHPVYNKVVLKRPRMVMDGSSSSGLKHFRAEAEIWSKLQHPNILRFIGAIEAENYIWLISPFAENGSLPDYIKARPETDREELVRQLIQAIEYLHRQNIVHGDIKGANILISESVDVQLCDFGLAKYQDMKTATSLKGAGTWYWSAPELLLEDEVSKTTASDVYAFGMTIYQILSGNIPFGGCSLPALVRAISSNKRPPKEPVASLSGSSYAVLWEIAEACWVAEASNRPAMSTIQARFGLDLQDSIMTTPRSSYMMDL